jgi:hypothetical protein
MHYAAFAMVVMSFCASATYLFVNGHPVAGSFMLLLLFCIRMGSDSANTEKK